MATAQTDSAGNYELTDVPAGNYFINATAPGFVTGKENQVIANLRFVTVIANRKVEGIDFELIRQGFIKGVVTDAGGKPVGGTPITIFPEELLAGHSLPLYARDLRTDDQGMFRVNGIPAGRYRLAAGDQSVVAATFFGRKGYRRVFYHDATDETQASVIEIAAGSEVTNLRINLGSAVKTFSVNAKIVDGQSGEPIEGVNYALEAYSNGKRIPGVLASERSNERGEITIKNIPAGEYSIRVPGGRGTYPKGEIPPPPNLFGDSKHFQVTDGDVNEIEIRVLRGATVSGFVVIEGPAGMDILSRVSQMKAVAMVFANLEVGPIMTTDIKPDGSFSFTGLRPGKLQVSFMPPAAGSPLPLRSLRTERDGVKLDQDLEIAAGDQIAGLRVVLGYSGSGSIQGLVKFANGSWPAGARLIARAFNGKNDVPPLGYIHVDSQGRFLIQNLPAGEYALEIGMLNSSSRLAEQKVVVSDNATTETTIHVDLATRANPK